MAAPTSSCLGKPPTKRKCSAPRPRESKLKALVTGIDGFAGSHLAEYLLARGIEVVGIVLDKGNVGNIAAIASRLTLYEADLLDAPAVQQALAQARPDLVFHLAGQASVSRSWEDPEETLRINILGQLHLLQAIVASELRPRILVVGSDEEYGLLRPEELPATEDSPLRPVNPYGISKVAQDLMGYQYFVSHALPIVRVRAFAHIGPRQREVFLVPSLAKQVAEAEAGLRDAVIYVGNLAVKRDFSDVRDIVRGYHLTLTQGEPGEVYNLGSGRMTSVKELLDLFLSCSRRPLEVKQDPQLLRPVDIAERVANCTRFRNLTNWEPRIPLEQTVADVLEYYRQQVAVADHT